MPNALSFENAVRDYLAGHRDWDSVHQLAIKMETENKVDFPLEIRRPIEELHLIFLTADSNDDPQFRADREEISSLIAELDRLKRDVSTLGATAVAERELALEQAQDVNRRTKYLERHMRRQRT
ncbi:MAG: hypothetical protein ACREA9_17045 [Pyrinomonadaceae bacterium]